ncbi:hypothetical protein BT63DRAFT_385530 [Microthyrium microscopicum]|uniref:General stress protein FMN-binding split barrel domain-containing protein n=1 Tax=Microthyrium microscopicum TaxID=703497 RepID=A0A6A6UH90_9PEZI|nr:hypothetical protein BT63DRAFT_385530 [Microthyrium microscopicum]
MRPFVPLIQLCNRRQILTLNQTNFSRYIKANMSTSTQDLGKPSDPYKEANLQKDVPLDEKVQDLGTFVEKCKFCMMATRIASSGLIVSRCMALAGKENNGVDFIFHANTESGKLDDLKSDSDINLGFLNSSGEWASISGKADVVTDREQIKKWYSESLKAWMGDLEDGKHDGGPEDPRICLIKVKAVTAQYATSRKGLIGSAVEFAKGVAAGNPPQLNKLRHLDEEEINQWRSK